MSENSKTKQQSGKKATSMADLMAIHSSSFKQLKKGELVKGKVKKLTPKEILLDINYKSDALVIEYDKRNLGNLLSILKVGDEVEASVISPESEEGFPVVSLRRMLEGKVYEKLSKLYSNQEIFEAVIAENTRGGYFVLTNEGVKGFLPYSQIIAEKFTPNSKVSVKIIEFDQPKKRIILSSKAVKFETNLTKINSLVKKGDIIEGEIINVSPYGLSVELKFDKTFVEGFIHISEISYERVENLESKFKKGEKVKAYILGIDTEGRRVNLSIKKLSEGSFEDTKKKFKEGDTLKGKIVDVKSRGVTLQLPDAKGFISSSRLQPGVEYKKDEEIEVEVVGFDDKKHLVNVSPVLTKKFVTYR